MTSDLSEELYRFLLFYFILFYRALCFHKLKPYKDLKLEQKDALQKLLLRDFSFQYKYPNVLESR